MIKRMMMVLLTAYVLSYTFYRSLWMLVPLAVLIFWLLEKTRAQKEHIVEIRSILTQIYSELLVGSPLKSAMKQVNGQSFCEPIRKGVKHMVLSAGLNRTELECFRELGEIINHEIFDDFIEILELNQTHGGEISSVLKNSIQLINDYINLSLESNAIIAGKKAEFYLMTVIPVVLVLFLSVSNFEYMSVLYSCTLGRVTMSIVLMTIIGGYYLGNKWLRL